MPSSSTSKDLYVAIGATLGVAVGLCAGVYLSKNSFDSLSQDSYVRSMGPLARSGYLATTTPYFAALGFTGGLLYGAAWPITLPLTALFYTN